MKSDLISRLEELEATAMQSSGSSKQQVNAEMNAKFLASIERMKKKQAEFDALDAAGRIGYWKRQLAEAEEIIASDGRYLNVYNESFRALKLISAREGVLGSIPFRLLEAQLDRLEELGYRADKLQEWRCVVKRYEKIYWQWRGEYLELSADALALLESDNVAA